MAKAEKKPAATSAQKSASIPAGLASKTRQDPLVLARQRDIRGRNAMTKAELVAALR